MTKVTSVETLEAQIGTPPGDASLRLTGANKELIREWLVAKGFDAGRAAGAREGTLLKAYTLPSYLRAMLTRGDYNSDRARPKPEAEPATERNPMPSPFPEPTPRLPEPSPLPPIVTGNAAHMLTAAIQAIAGQAINETRVIELIQEHAPTREIIREKIVIQANGERRELPEGARHEKFPDILAAVMANIPVMLVGPAGSGKTTLAKQIAETVERPFAHIGAVTSRFELSGFVDAHGNYQATPFFRAYTEGHVFLFDEVDASDPAALLWCNTAIANGFCAFPHGEFPRHPEFRLIAAANTFGHGQDRVYVGRNQLDGATLDRFITIDYNYDETLERKVFGDTTWTHRVHDIRRAVVSLKLRHVVSSRAIEYGSKLLAAGIPQTQVEAMTLWKGLDGPTVAKIRENVL